MSLQDDSIPMPSSDSGNAGAEAKVRGYPISLMASGKVDDRFICTHCKLILRSPVQSLCGHRYCKECVKNMQKLPPPVICKLCEEEEPENMNNFDFTEVFEDNSAKREMKKLQVKCFYTGCSWRGTFQQYLDHEETCERKLVECIQCGANVSKQKMSAHKNKCPKRPYVCTYCKTEVPYDFKEKHSEQCPKYVIQCNNCKTQVERSMLSYHQQQTCSNRIVLCPLPSCKAQLPMEKFLAHISKEESVAKHIEYLFQKQEITDRKLEQLNNAASFPQNVEVNPAHASASSADEGIQLADAKSQQDGAQAEGGNANHNVQHKLKLHEDLMSVLHAEILRCITKGEAMGRGIETFDKRLWDCYAKIEDFSVQLNELKKKVGMTVDLSHGELISEGNSMFTWVIKQFSKVKLDAESGEREMICSPTFFSCPGGYQMRLKFYVNGTVGENRNKNASLFLQMVRGPNDDLLLWPFAPKVHFMLVDQIDFRNHHVNKYCADSSSPAWGRPASEFGTAAGCPAFITKHELIQKSTTFWPKDTLYLKFNLEIPADNLDRMKALNPLNYPMPSHSSQRVK